MATAVQKAGKFERKKSAINTSAVGKSLVSIQVLRGVAALLVVLLHLAGREGQCPGAPHILQPFSSEFFGFYAVNTFFIISGFVMCTAHYDDFGSAGKVKVYLQKRFIRLFPFYWLTCIPLILLKKLAIDTTLVGALCLVPVYAGRINRVAWTLSYELLFLCVFAVLMLFPRKLLPVFMTLWLACILVGSSISLPTLQDGGYLATLVNPYNIDFLLGIALALLVKQTKMLPYPPFLIVGAVALILATPLKEHGVWIYSSFVHILAIALPSFLITYGLIALEKQRTFKFPKPLVVLGDASYSVYLVHYVIISALSLTWRQIGSSAILVPWSLTLAVAIPLICVGVYFLIEKPMFTALRKTISKRKAA